MKQVEDKCRPLEPNWLEEVRTGDFSAMPELFAWNDSVEFARLIDGYRLATRSGAGACGDLANRLADEARTSGEWKGSATELWLCLFFEHRRWRHFGDGPRGEDLRELDALCATLRSRLQSLDRLERELILSALGASA